MSWYRSILKIKPDGKAFRSIENTKILFEVLAAFFQSIIEYAILTINDQVWYVNSNFDPEPWERRYQIIPPENATLEQRREYMKSLMLFPQSQNRLSKDYFSDVLESSGYTGITLSYNASGAPTGYLHANGISDETGDFSIGSNSYNSFIVSGSVSSTYYWQVLLLLMSLKPLQVALYDELEVYFAVALSDSLAWAILTDVDDWFLPSLDEIEAMYTNLHAYGVGGFSNVTYWSSSEYDATDAYDFSFLTGTDDFNGKSSTRYVRACRSFTAEVGAYSLRDTGPTGGLIFYIDGTTYYEAAPADQSTSKAWSNVTGSAVGTTGTAIGDGEQNTQDIIGQGGHTDSSALVCDAYYEQIYLTVAINTL